MELVSASRSKLARRYICHHGGNSISQMTCCCIKDLHQKGQRWSENGMVQDTDTSTYASAWVADTSYTRVE